VCKHRVLLLAGILLPLLAIAGKAHGQADSPSSAKPLPNTHHNTADDVKVYFWANDLYDACHNDSVETGDSIVTATKKTFNKGQCGGYILAYAEALGKSVGVCLPVHAPGNDVVEGVKGILDKDSTLRDKQLPAAAAVGIALQILFPCPAK
jgi:hypothetical protein